MSRVRRVDQNQAEIVATLRAVGARVLIVNGVFDLVIWFRGRLYLADCKNREGRNRLTEMQRTLVAEGWPLLIMRDPDEALAAIGARVTAV